MSDEEKVWFSETRVRDGGFVRAWRRRNTFKKLQEQGNFVVLRWRRYGKAHTGKSEQDERNRRSWKLGEWVRVKQIFTQADGCILLCVMALFTTSSSWPPSPFSPPLFVPASRLRSPPGSHCYWSIFDGSSYHTRCSCVNMRDVCLYMCLCRSGRHGKVLHRCVPSSAARLLRAHDGQMVSGCVFCVWRNRESDKR